MKTRQFRIRWLSALICLFVVFGSSEVVVVCTCEDGHIAVEIAGSGCCEHIHEGLSEGDATAFVEDSRSPNDHDGSCVHIPLSGGSAGILSTSKKVAPSFGISSNVSGVHILAP
ncbi:MAG: hypothetical protein ACYS29_16675, partial [Planctomycetota bacterium]